MAMNDENNSWNESRIGQRNQITKENTNWGTIGDDNVMMLNQNLTHGTYCKMDTSIINFRH